MLKAVPKTVIIRTLDLGADKQITDSTDVNIKPNPALGLRAIRLCLKDLSLFKLQLRAIFRAAVYGHAKIMIPMISNIEEILQVKRVIKQVHQELKQDKIEFNADIPLGMMVEVPSMAICSDLFAPHVDFFSIGTNDLIQYTLAIDRVDNDVSHLYDPLHPAILRLLKITLEAGRKYQLDVSLCGEMAGDSEYIRLLLGLGLRHFSVNPESLLEVKSLICRTDLRQIVPLCEKIINSADKKHLRQWVTELNALPMKT